MTQNEHPSFSYETREMKEKILVRDWTNWLVCKSHCMKSTQNVALKMQPKIARFTFSVIFNHHVKIFKIIFFFTEKINERSPKSGKSTESFFGALSKEESNLSTS